MKLLPESKYIFQFQEQVSKTITSKAANILIIDYLCKYMCVYIYVYTHTHFIYEEEKKAFPLGDAGQLRWAGSHGVHSSAGRNT